MTNIFGFLRTIYFIGIGGIGMSGIARILNSMEFCVSGSDANESATTENLRQMGIPVHIGHRAENLQGADLVVYSSAIKDDNPELLQAANLCIPRISRGELLSEISRLKYSIAVAGSHGKSSTSSMVSDILTLAGYDPTSIIGGVLSSTGSNAHLGAKNVLVAESDESDRSFVMLYPSIAVITNIDQEHLNSYTDMDDLKSAFAQFANKVPFYGCVVLCIDDANTSDIIPEINRRVTTYGFKAQANVRAVDIESSGFSVSFNVEYNSTPIGHVIVNKPGNHTILNSLAAIAVALEMQVPFSIIAEALYKFQGVERRMSIRYRDEKTVVIDDYAHHPTEVEVTLKACREAFKGYRICAVFQPHRYTRLKALKTEFAKAFMDADHLFVTDVYAASEQPIEGVSPQGLIDETKRYGFKEAGYLPVWGELWKSLGEIGLDKTVIITLGAGNITELSRELAKLLEGVRV
jgi:UDP-N-acetylmuramate--alanine ligase